MCGAIALHCNSKCSENPRTAYFEMAYGVQYPAAGGQNPATDDVLTTAASSAAMSIGLPNVMTSSEERTSAESKSCRPPHQRSRWWVEPIRALEQVLGWKGVTELPDRPEHPGGRHDAFECDDVTRRSAG